MKKNNFKGVFAFWTAVFLICGAAQGVMAQDVTNWREAESYDELIGRWEGNLTIHVPRNVEEMIPETSIKALFFMNITKNPDNTDTNFKISMRFDLENFLNDFLSLPEVKPTGLTKDIFWEILAGEFRSGMEGLADDLVIQKYYVIFTALESSGEEYSESGGKVLINDDKNIMKLIFDEPIEFLPPDVLIREIILKKID
ncbi:MAG: hypothetical protein LBQ93_06020 [Treponema sp.]|jgi:hypothetical protein|nr:hypothetical protein [Treponema sp.]